jgi:5-deoxy-5-amino-3-dehydroquinate synthase
VIRVPVPLGDRSYDVLVGPGARHELASVVPATARRVAVVTQEAIPVEVDPGRPAERFTIARRPRRWRPSRSCAAGSPASG